MSYNIWNLNQRREFNYFDRIQAIADQILTLEIDVVAFQEVRLTNHEYPSNTYCNHAFSLLDFHVVEANLVHK